MSKGKWFGDLSPGTPLEDAARRVVSVRLEVVRDHLGLALRKPEKDPEYVHQLRVGTRRAGAALKVFSQCFAKKPLRAARNRMRDLRRAAGGARDWDVFLLNLRKSTDELSEEMRSGLDFLYGFAIGQRLRAQQELDGAFPNFPFSFDKFLTDTSAAVRKRNDSTLGQLAAVAVPKAVDDLERVLDQYLQDHDLLHVARLMGKRLRYAMEIFSGCFEPEFKKSLYPQVVEMQGILGDANDAHVAIPRFSNLLARLKPMLPGDWKRYAPLLEHQLEQHRDALPDHRQRFNQWLVRWRELGGTAAFTELLITDRREPAPFSSIKASPEVPAAPSPAETTSNVPNNPAPATNAESSPPTSTESSPNAGSPQNGTAPAEDNAHSDSDDSSNSAEATADGVPWSGVISEFFN